jgi:hypothetical protein
MTGPKCSAQSFSDRKPKEVVMTKIVTAILMLFIAWSSFAADPNGYTAQYECRAGGPNCNVDVVTLATQACQQTITTSTAPPNNWSSINWSNTVICIENGDHTGRGPLTLGSSGTSGVQKILRYTRSGDNNDEPWNQSTANQAKISRIDLSGRDYWIIHRLTIDGNYGNNSLVFFGTNSDYNILNRSLVQKANEDLIYFYPDGGAPSPTNNTVQNSVIRKSQISKTLENDCITTVAGENNRVVNNEIYACNKMVFFQQDADHQGFVVENNDIYDDPADWTDCNGNSKPNGPCGIAEAHISMKDGSSNPSNPVKIIHNRIWGARETDATIAQSSVGVCSTISAGGTGDQQPANGNGASWVIFLNNICFDSSLGFQNYWNGPENISIIGNIFYDIRHNPALYQYLAERGALGFWRVDKVEIYLNTFVDVENWLWLAEAGHDNHDTRCNVMIASGAKIGKDNIGAQYNHNIYYGTTDTGEATKIVKTLTTRTNSTAYNLNQIIRTTSAPPANGTAGDFLYKVTVSGTSAGSAPAYCVTLGCTTTDGSMTVQAVRGPYTFMRKLRIGAEQYTIPYAMVHASAPEINGCPIDYASRKGIGINDQ